MSGLNSDDDSFVAVKPKNDLEKKGYTKLTPTGKAGANDGAFESGGSAGLIEDKQCDEIIEAFSKRARKSSKSPLVIKRFPLGMIMYTDTGKDVFTYLMIFPSGVLGASVNERTQDGDSFSCVKDGEYYAGILKVKEE
jgi:hypothetical protein